MEIECFVRSLADPIRIPSKSRSRRRSQDSTLPSITQAESAALMPPIVPLQVNPPREPGTSSGRDFGEKRAAT
jgi:hypothetical protein